MGMKQQTFSDIEYSNRRKKTRREEFLNSMDEIIPWDHWVSLIRPYYPSGKRGRLPKNIEAMLRMYLMQNWFNLSDAGIEDAIYDSYAMRSFMHLDFLIEQVPDATTLLHFRHLLEDNRIGEMIFADVKAKLEKAGLMMHAERLWMPPSSQLQALPRIKKVSATRKCTRPKRETNGIMK